MRREFRTAHSWVATVASVSALAFSGYNFLQLQEDPQTVVTLPLSLKVQHWKGGTSLFIQPTVSTRFDTEDVEMITDVRLHLRPAITGPEPRFFWQQNVKWWVDHAAKADDKTSVWYQYDADPSPFVVTQTDPKQPVMQFTTFGWTLTPGRFEGTLTVHRASTRAPIERPFCLVLRAKDIETLTKNDGWYELRTDVPGPDDDGCFHWYA